MSLLTNEDIINRLKNYPDWEFSDDSVFKEFVCKSFSDAVAFIVKIGFEAEKLDHHPDIYLHSWNKVKIILSSHSAGGVTEMDFLLLTNIEKIKP